MFVFFLKLGTPQCLYRAIPESTEHQARASVCDLPDRAVGWAAVCFLVRQAEFADYCLWDRQREGPATYPLSRPDLRAVESLVATSVPRMRRARMNAPGRATEPPIMRQKTALHEEVLEGIYAWTYRHSRLSGRFLWNLPVCARAFKALHRLDRYTSARLLSRNQPQ